MPDALYHRDGAHVVPTDLTRGPWNPEAQHGGAPSALLATCIEGVPTDVPMHTARLTIELLRPVPVAPLVVTTTIARPGRKVQLVEAAIHAGTVEVARARALRIRTAPLPAPPNPDDPIAPPGPEHGQSSAPPWSGLTAAIAYHSHAVDHHFAVGSFAEPGPAVDWIRLRVPVIDGEPVVPAARVAAAADFGNGVSWTLPRAQAWTFINPELTIHTLRPSVGEWICLDAITLPGASGIGLAESRLWDTDGLLGRATQSLLLERHG